jgi:Family of unknown function (DUF6152)
MHRRTVLLASLTSLPLPALAHHGWSSFDQNRPLWLQGKAVKVAWKNPHAEFDLNVAANLALPPDLASRTVPAQSAPVDGPGLLRAARLPTRRDRRWHIELAPISRLEAWKVPPVKDGDEVGLLGFSFAEEKGEALMRVEYLFHAGQVFGLRSAPA